SGDHDRDRPPSKGAREHVADVDLRSVSDEVGRVLGRASRRGCMWGAEALSAVRPLFSLPGPVLGPPAVRLEHPERQDVVDVLRVPPCARDLEPDLDDVAVSALDLAARRAPAELAIFGVGDGVLVAVDVAGLDAQIVDARRVRGPGLPPGASQLEHDL